MQCKFSICVKYVKSQKQETFGISALKRNGNVITDSLSKAEIVNSQFKSVFTLELHISENCVFMLLDRIDVSKLSGPDKLPRRLLQSLAKEITPVVQLSLINHVALENYLLNGPELMLHIF